MKKIVVVLLTAMLLFVAVAPAAAQGCDGCVFVNPLVAPLLLPFAVAATITAGVAAVVTAPFAYPYAPYPYAYPYAYPYPYAYAPRVVVEQSALSVYAQPQHAPPVQQYWYYCEDPKGYYPYVSQCPRGWMQVVPPTQSAR